MLRDSEGGEGFVDLMNGVFFLIITERRLSLSMWFVYKCVDGKEGFWEKCAAPTTHWSSGCWENPSV